MNHIGGNSHQFPCMQKDIFLGTKFLNANQENSVRCSPRILLPILISNFSQDLYILLV